MQETEFEEKDVQVEYDEEKDAQAELEKFTEEATEHRHRDQF